MALNIPEGHGKASNGDRRRYFERARASALQCAATEDEELGEYRPSQFDTDSDTETD